jgi:hypothetical protein
MALKTDDLRQTVVAEETQPDGTINRTLMDVNVFDIAEINFYLHSFPAAGRLVLRYGKRVGDWTSPVSWYDVNWVGDRDITVQGASMDGILDHITTGQKMSVELSTLIYGVAIAAGMIPADATHVDLVTD